MMDNINLEDIRKYLPRINDVKKMKEFYFIFSDMTRLFILTTLTLKELCVSQISEILSVNQTTISHQLKFLKSLNIVDSRREKSLIYYRIVNPFVSDVITLGVNQINYMLSCREMYN